MAVPAAILAPVVIKGIVSQVPKAQVQTTLATISRGGPVAKGLAVRAGVDEVSFRVFANKIARLIK